MRRDFHMANLAETDAQDLQTWAGFSEGGGPRAAQSEIELAAPPKHTETKSADEGVAARVDRPDETIGKKRFRFHAPRIEALAASRSPQ